MISIVIADDHKLFRETLADVLNANPAFRVIAFCQDSEEVIEIVKTEKPDVVLMDINMHPFSGVIATEKIAEFSGAKIIGLSMHSHPAYAKKMFRAGASGYVTKNSSTEEIFAAVTTVAKGKRYICSETKNMLSEDLLNNPNEKTGIGLLTEREMEVINCVRKGLSSKEIAGNFSISLKTVEVHRHNILKKLKLKNSTSLVNFIHQSGFLFQ
ncbi:MAG: response regulator transcription factor [Chitinophagaceae bacterium]